MISFAGLGLGEVVADKANVAVLRFLLDDLAAVHLLRKFRGKEPLLAEVTIVATEHLGQFDINLHHMRAALEQSYGQRQLIYDLRIEGTRQNGSTLTWLIPAGKIPKATSLLLSPTCMPQYRV